MAQDHQPDLKEWLWPSLFFLAFFWTLWHIPAFLLDFFPPESESLKVQILDWFTRKDALPQLGGLISAHADAVDWLALIMLPIAFAFGIRNITIAPMELDLSRNCSVPLIWYFATKEKIDGERTQRRIQT